MVAQKITCPSRSDDIGNRYANSNTKRHGFFANESQDSKYFEGGRTRSFKARKESAGERFNRSGYRRIFGSDAFIASGHHQLFRGKGRLQQPWVNNIIPYYFILSLLLEITPFTSRSSANMWLSIFRSVWKRSRFTTAPCFTIRTQSSSKIWSSGAPLPPRKNNIWPLVRIGFEY